MAKKIQLPSGRLAEHANVIQATTNTWHHHQDGETLQEVNKEIHKDYTHRGGMSLKKKQ
ncbi:HNH endonuclease [Listeria booriae]|nr:HNH endonuclease [Listeria booriae]MCD2206651.1 HNH endonuclease [Listeria booriae]